jgi:hypothetical protein
MCDVKDKNIKNVYIMSSERAYRRNDESRNMITTPLLLDIGDSIELDGIKWYVDEIVEINTDK